MAGRLFGWATQFLPLPRAPSFVSHFGGYINAQGYSPWVKICSPEISRLHLTLAELDFENPTIKSLRAPNNSAIVLKNSNHNNRQSLICAGYELIITNSAYGLVGYLVNKPLPAAGLSADNVRGWEIVRKMNIWPRSEASRANVKFWGQSLSQGHYQPIDQQAGKGFIYFITPPINFFRN